MTMDSLQIRPNRLEVSDRFPMLGFSVRASTPVSAEIVLARDWSLLDPKNKGLRTAMNFFCTRREGPLVFNGGNTVYMVPPDALANFVGAKELYFGVAATPLKGGGAWEVQAPSQGSAYISLKGFTGRTLRRLAVAPGRGNGRGYGTKGLVLDWAGDEVKSNGGPARTAPGATNGTSPAVGATPAPADLDYQDGFGTLAEPPPARAATPAPVPAAPPAVTQARVQGYGRGQDFTGDLLRGALATVASDVPQIRVYKVANAFADVQFAALYAELPAPLRNMIDSARRDSYALAVGPQVSVASASAGAGVVFDSNGDVGLYAFGDAGVDVGDPLGSAVGLLGSLHADATLGVTIVQGTIMALEGVRKALGATIGLEVVGGVHALFGANLEFLGVAAGLGVGVELEIGELIRKVRAFLSTSVQSGLVRAQAAVPARPRPVRRIVPAAQQGLLDELVNAVADDLPQIYVKRLGNPLEYPDVAAAIAALPEGVQSVIASARGLGFTLGMERKVVVGPASAGAGIAWDTGGNVGVYYYGDHGLDLDDLAGSLLSILSSLEANVTARHLFIKGEIGDLANLRKAVGATLGEEIVGGAYALFDGGGQFRGIALEAGVGVELNLGEYLDKVKKLLPAPVRSALGLAVAQDFMGDLQRFAIGLLEPYRAPTVVPIPEGALREVWKSVARAVAAAAAGPLAPEVALLPEMARLTHYTLAFGLAGEAEVVKGRAGCIFGRDGRAGIYHFGQASLGALELVRVIKDIVSQLALRADLSQQLTILDGDIEDLGRLSFHAGIKETVTVEGVPLVLGVDALFDDARTLKGATLDLGVGLALEIRKLKGLAQLLPWLRKLPSPHAEATGWLVRAKELSTEDLLARAGAVDPLYGESLRALLDDGSLSPEQAADVVAFLEPDAADPAADLAGESAFKGASLQARAAALSRRLPVRRRGAGTMGVPGQRGKVSWDLEGYPEVRAPLSSRGTPALQTVETVLDNWPISPDGTALPLRVAWQFDPQTGAAGGVVVEAREPREGSATALEVKSCVGPLREERGLIAIPLTITYRFSRAGAPAEVAATELVLRGDGTFDRTDRPATAERMAG
jgi:hypothetical protein